MLTCFTTNFMNVIECKPRRKVSLKDLNYKCEKNINMELREIMCKVCTRFDRLRQVLEAGRCKHEFYNSPEFFEQLSDYQLLKKDSAPLN